MKIQAVCIGAAERLGERKTKTGIFKHPVGGAVIVDGNGLAGDAVVNRKHHGGPDQALYIEGSVTLDWWAAELGRPYRPGLFGENLVIEGLDNRRVAAGDRFHAGDVVLEATAPRIPCSTFTLRMGDPGFARRYTKAARPGFYVRVLKGGVIAAGDAVRLEPFDGERVTVAEMMAAFGRKLAPGERARHLAAPVSIRYRAALGERA